MSNQEHLPERLKISKWTTFLLAFALFGIYLLLPQLSDLPGIFKLLGEMNIRWIAGGLMCTGLTLAAGGLLQYYAGNNLGTVRETTIVSLAALFVSRFMPVNLGGITLVARYYKRQHVKASTALSYAVLPPVLAVATPVTLLVLISPLTIAQAAADLGNYVLRYGLIAFLVVTICVLLMASRSIRHSMQRAKYYLIQAWRLYTPTQKAYIASSTLLFFIFSASVFLISAWSLDSSLPFLNLIAIFISATVAGQIIPTPGGIGTTEALLVLGLSGLGLDLTAAVTITLLFRLFLFWLPMIPGSICFMYLTRQTKHLV